jgi:thiol-disulfide isomerase/thioredoxin
MPKYERFAASFLSTAAVAVALFAAPAAAAANLRTMEAPAELAKAFPAKAKVRVLNVWATWCMPCVAEMPDLRAIDEAFGEEVAIVGLSLDPMLPSAKREKTAEFLDKHKIAFPNFFYTGDAELLGEHLKATGEIPITIVYDRTGREVWRHEGRVKLDEAMQRIRAALAR